MNRKWEVLDNFYTLDDTTPIKNSVRRFIDDFPEVRYLILCGAKGTGKSHIARFIHNSMTNKQGVVYFPAPPESFDIKGDVFIVENVNFYNHDQLEKFYRFLRKNKNKNFVITIRGSCDSPIIRTIRGILGKNGDYFYLPAPPYELQRAILEGYLKFQDIEISPHTLDLLLEKLEWPAPLRFIDMVKTRSILLSENMDDESIFSLIREFLGDGS